MRTWHPLALAACMLAACGGEVVDTTGVPALYGYEGWHRVDSTGPVAGHGDSYRIIYANDAAREYGHAGSYRIGSILVKEIRELQGGLPGDVKYYAVMRKLREAPPGGKLEGGWLFTMLTDLDGDETQGVTCWHECHAQAPVDGAWFDYGQ